MGNQQKQEPEKPSIQTEQTKQTESKPEEKHPETVTVVTQDGEPEEMTWTEFRTWYKMQEDTSTKLDKMYRKMFPEEFQEEQGTQEQGNQESISPQGSEQKPEEERKSKLPKGFLSNLKR